MTDKQFIEAMELIVSALKERGYDPYLQLYGYLKENEPMYITSYNGAREMIQQLSYGDINLYMKRVLCDAKHNKNHLK